MQNRITHFKKILNIESIQINVIQNTQFFESTLDYDSEQDKWIILYNDELSDAYLVHELGHLYLMNQLIDLQNILQPHLRNMEK